MNRDKATWPGAKIRKKGEGMPNYENNNLHGTLYVTFDVEFPKQEFTPDEKEGKLARNCATPIEHSFDFVSLFSFTDLRRILAQSANNRVYNGLNGS